MENTKAPSFHPAWPDWLEEKRIDDALSADAYESAGKNARAAIKTAIALYLRVNNSKPGKIVHQESIAPTSGFWTTGTLFPAPWAVVAFTPKYAAAARLLGAILPAITAGVQLVAAVCVGGTPKAQLLAALELAGVEDVFSLSVVETSMLLEETQPGPGRLVLLHSGELDGLRIQASALNVPFFEERADPILTIPRPELFDLDLLRFAQGELALERALESPNPASPDALYASEDAVRSHCLANVGNQFSLGMAPLALAPGCECLWIHQSLSPNFFLARRTGFGLCH